MRMCRWQKCRTAHRRITADAMPWLTEADYCEVRDPGYKTGQQFLLVRLAVGEPLGIGGFADFYSA